MARRVKAAAFRDPKTLEDFDFSFNPTIKKKPIFELATCKFIREGRDVLLLGPPGTGKSHLAQAMGYDLEQMGDSFLDTFAKQQGYDGVEEIQAMAERDGMTLGDVKKKLTLLYGPDEVIRFEVSNRISLSETEIENYYTSNPELFRVDGEVILREIVLLTQDTESSAARRPEAEKTWERATSGEDFASLAREVSDAGTNTEGGKLGPLKKTDLSSVLVDSAFTLPVGGVSELMETPYGFHIIKVVSRIDVHVKSIDDVRARIREFLQARKFRTELEAFLEKARAESEWCVKPKHTDLLSVPAPPPCERL